jgi:ABC-type thiamine transport system ATPase subunit
MIEDKLTHDERLRLECLAQAIQTVALAKAYGVGSSPILDVAADFEKFVRAAGDVRV